MVWHSTPFSVPVGKSTEPVPVVDPVVGLIAPLSAEHEAHAPLSMNVADIEMRTHHELTRILAECAGRRRSVVPSDVPSRSADARHAEETGAYRTLTKDVCFFAILVQSRAIRPMTPRIVGETPPQGVMEARGDSSLSEILLCHSFWVSL